MCATRTRVSCCLLVRWLRFLLENHTAEIRVAYEQAVREKTGSMVGLLFSEQDFASALLAKLLLHDARPSDAEIEEEVRSSAEGP